MSLTLKKDDLCEQRHSSCNQPEDTNTSYRGHIEPNVPGRPRHPQPAGSFSIVHATKLAVPLFLPCIANHSYPSTAVCLLTQPSS